MPDAGHQPSQLPHNHATGIWQPASGIWHLASGISTRRSLKLLAWGALLAAHSAAVKNLQFFVKALKLTWPYRFRVLLGIACGSLAGIANPLLMGSVKLVVDSVFPTPGAPTLASQLGNIPPFLQRFLPDLSTLDVKGSDTLTVLIILTIPAVMLLRGLSTYLNTYLMTWAAIRTIFDLRIRVFSHLLTLSAHYFNRISTGELISRFTEIQVLQGILGNSLVIIIREPITILGLLVFLFSQQPQLTLVAMVVFPLTITPFLVFSHRMRKSSNQMYSEYAELSKLLHETFTAYRVVKAYNLEIPLIERYAKMSRSVIGAFMRMTRSMEMPGPMIEFFGAIGMAMFFIYLAFYTAEKSPGGLLSFAGSIFLMYAPIKNLVRLHAQLQQANAASQFIFQLLETPTTVTEPAQPKPVKAAGQPIRFEHVNFGYDDKPVLHDFNLTVQPGQLVALVGGSGAGKTTVTSLLLRFYDPTKGVIRIGDTDIRDVTTADLRRHLGVVTQETVLFNDSIKHNIALGRPGATDAEIITAAKHAHAHEFILAKPQGYDTQIGERGVQLSGGQRQRIAIARAILKGAPILLLDEATSALDTESERAVQAALDDLMENRTTLCIAHRLSTIHHADLIVVMDQGRIVETGRHTDLIQTGGVYQRLYELQFRSAPTA
jgi:subfamily B ATP-binding cassette protein MsbA